MIVEVVKAEVSDFVIIDILLIEDSFGFVANLLIEC